AIGPNSAWQESCFVYMAMEGRTMLRTPWICLFLCFGCSENKKPVVFHGEAPALPGFGYDTGLQPSISPVQIDLMLSAAGSAIVDASGSANGSQVVGTPGSGKFALDVHIKAAGRLKVALSAINYDGNIPGIDGLDIAFGGMTMFDPFLLSDKATL